MNVAVAVANVIVVVDVAFVGSVGNLN